MSDKFLQNVGLAKQAGRLVRGRDETLGYLTDGKVKGAFVAADASERTKNDISRKCIEGGKEYRILPYTMEQLGRAAGEKPLAVFSVKDTGMFRLLISSLTAEKKEAGKYGNSSD